LPARRASGVVFAASSVVTPFFLGTVAGGIASGRVPTGGNGDAVTSWLNPTSILGGSLAVVTCAYLAAVFLAADARSHGEPVLERWFRRRATASAIAGGTLAAAGIVVLHADAHHLWVRLLGPALPLLFASGVAGVAALLLLGRVSVRRLRVMAVIAVGAVVSGWGVAQYPYLLGTHDRLSDGAAPDATLWAVVVVFGIAALLVVPSLALLYVLQQRGQLDAG
jgi:cytochrome d ubiquinol oxidase subunit II